MTNKFLPLVYRSGILQYLLPMSNMIESKWRNYVRVSIPSTQWSLHLSLWLINIIDMLPKHYCLFGMNECYFCDSNISIDFGCGQGFIRNVTEQGILVPKCTLYRRIVYFDLVRDRVKKTKNKTSTQTPTYPHTHTLTQNIYLDMK